jgi:hypothetical protein
LDVSKPTLIIVIRTAPLAALLQPHSLAQFDAVGGRPPQQGFQPLAPGSPLSRRFRGDDEFGCRQDLLTASYAGVTKTPRLRTKKSGHRITVTRPSFLSVPRRSRKPRADRFAGGYRPAGVRTMSPDGSPVILVIDTDPGEAGVSNVIVLCDARVWPPWAAIESART